MRTHSAVLCSPSYENSNYKVRKWDGEGTFAGTRDNDGVAPRAVIPRSSSHFVKGIGGISENIGRGSLTGDWLAYSYPNLDRRFGMLRS